MSESDTHTDAAKRLLALHTAVGPASEHELRHALGSGLVCQCQCHGGAEAHTLCRHCDEAYGIWEKSQPKLEADSE